MRRIQIDYGNTNNIINNLKNIVINLENEKRQIKNALNELYDLENYYYSKGEILRELEYRERQVSKDIEDTGILIENINAFSTKVKEVDENLANKFKQDVAKYSKENNIEITNELDAFLNKVQVGLDVIGLVPVVGDICDGINGVISLARGDISGALISFVAMVPFIGDSVKGLKYMDKASDLLKLGDKVVDIGKSTAKVGEKKLVKLAKKETLEIISKGEKEFKKVLEATLDLGQNDYVAWIKNKGEVPLNTVTDELSQDIQVCINNGCLVGDTLVKTIDGLKVIKEIKVGDLVLSKNEETGLTEYKKVSEIHKNSTYEICVIKTENSIIEGTTGHLFMIKDKWWTPAIDIENGDLIEVSDGTYEKIIDIEISENAYPISVYNLTVEDNHNYFVGYGEILTHNMTIKNDCSKFNFGKYLRQLIGPPPEGMIDPHAHHILFKKGRGKIQQELVKEGQAILRKYDIDPIFGKENLVWAPNRVKGQHSTEVVEELVSKLKETDDFFGEYDEIIEILNEFAQKARDRK
ncbi:polymorphic toxin-type HINT domain-containing protein [Paraclostridium ghonii]|uniref:polymorphic toxin-type HINT domain-containing protein n=1 Tax=Paraclostridium ghonii TaxID=29358 RepID=UPI0035246854